MNKLEIIKVPDARLRETSRLIGDITSDIVGTVGDMFRLMSLAGGVGLAAPQVGLNIRMFIKRPDKVYINPVISELKGEHADTEGCLSIPYRVVKVKRATSLNIKALDVEGKEIEETLTDYEARIVQHENDHLDGVLITDYLSK